MLTIVVSGWKWDTERISNCPQISPQWEMGFQPKILHFCMKISRQDDFPLTFQQLKT